MSKGAKPPGKNGILCILGTSLLVQRTALGAGGAQPLVGPLEKMCFSGRRGGPNTSGPLEKKKFSLRAGGAQGYSGPPSYLGGGAQGPRAPPVPTPLLYMIHFS